MVHGPDTAHFQWLLIRTKKPRKPVNRKMSVLLQYIFVADLELSVKIGGHTPGETASYAVRRRKRGRVSVLPKEVVISENINADHTTDKEHLPKT